MPSAPCPDCGESVIPYRQYALLMRSRTPCASCGRAVRVRGHLPAAAGSLVAGVAFVYLVVASPVEDVILLCLAFGTAAFLLDYAMWRWLGFSSVGVAGAAGEAAHDGEAAHAGKVAHAGKAAYAVDGVIPPVEPGTRSSG